MIASFEQSIATRVCMEHTDRRLIVRRPCVRVSRLVSSKKTISRLSTPVVTSHAVCMLLHDVVCRRRDCVSLRRDCGAQRVCACVCVSVSGGTRRQGDVAAMEDMEKREQAAAAEKERKRGRERI